MASRLNYKQVFSYASGNFGLNLFFSSISTYLLYFYTDNMGITAAAAGTLMFVAQLVNLVTNPLMGVLVDRTNTRWGKFRPYFLFGCVPLAVIGLLVFSVPSTDASGKIVYAYITYILFNVIYSIINIPYSSTLAAMSDDYYARSRISSIKVFLGQFGGLIVSSATLPMIHSFSTEAGGFHAVYTMYGAVLVITMLITFFGTRGVGHRPPVKPQAGGESAPQLTLSNQLKTVLLNKYLLWLLLFILVNTLSLSTKNAASLYFFKYNVGNADLFSVYSLVGFTIQIIGILLNPLLVAKWGKRNVGIISQTIVIVGLAGFYMLHSSMESIFFFGGVSYLGFGLTIPLLWAMVPDTIEYGTWRTGVRSEGTIYSAFIFVQLLSQAVGSKISGAILTAIGYVPNAAQTAGALHGILVMVTVIPIAGSIIGIAVLAFYKLDDKTFKRYVSEIEARTTTLS
ncbi:glycoside-pentoside-hexuronide (GPH):cation symporter [Paenibacillus doosanensis]|uniref:glycoside-pentoside-hexuronide (GPH):cation symporter n=1 Tax=Paenibacillus doosanensis TaxID=1229154 RepID=UPI00218095E6|nr:glycoside-pentoside-hexuronide (GPH):cation symporter [Paenibacillus doosanensis]MCS7461946.1 glycoside-pentoside-hexuronide (GPH):cation symporter [Paenibacillus doosanensis]